MDWLELTLSMFTNFLFVLFRKKLDWKEHFSFLCCPIWQCYHVICVYHIFSIINMIKLRNTRFLYKNNAYKKMLRTAQGFGRGYASLCFNPLSANVGYIRHHTVVTSDSCNSGHSDILTFSCKSLKFST